MVASSDLVGALLAMAAAFVSNFGVQLQKRVHNQEKALPAKDRKPYTRRPMWWIGFGGVVAGSLGDFAALGVAEQALVTAVGGASTLLCNLFVSQFCNNEKLKRIDVVGVSLIIAGAILIALASPPSEKYNLHQLLELSKNPYFIAYLIVTIVVIFILLATITTTTFYAWWRKGLNHLLRPLVRRLDCMDAEREAIMNYVTELESRVDVLETRERKMGRPRSSSSGGVQNQYIAARAKSVRLREEVKSSMCKLNNIRDYKTNPEKYARWNDAFIFAASSGTVGALSVLLAGIVSHTLVLALQFWFTGGKNGDNQLNEFSPWLFIFGMVVTIVCQTQLLNAGLALEDVMVVFPVFQTFWIGFGVIGGIVFYQLRARTKPKQWTMFGAAGVLMLTGCFLLMKHGREQWKLRKRRQSEGEHLLSSPASNLSDVLVQPHLGTNSLPPNLVQPGYRALAASPLE